jgi:hypothetical protein
MACDVRLFVVTTPARVIRIEIVPFFNSRPDLGELAWVPH